MAPSIWQILLIVLVVLLIFGAGKIPQIMGDMAKGFKSFKKGLEDEDGNVSADDQKSVKSIEKNDAPKSESPTAAPEKTKDKA